MISSPFGSPLLVLGVHVGVGRAGWSHFERIGEDGKVGVGRRGR